MYLRTPRISRKHAAVCLMFFIVLFLLHFFKFSTVTRPNPGIISNAKITHKLTHMEKNDQNNIQKQWVILLYTGLFYQAEWKQVPFGAVVNYTQNNKCTVNNCIVTYDKTQNNTADALIFHSIDLQGPYQHSASSLHQLARKFKNPRQRWVFLSHETPIYTWNFTAYDGLFNWTMSYTTESDVFWPYFYYDTTNIDYQLENKITKNYAKEKDKLIVWVVSHCGLLREDYVLKLQEYIQVDVYGKCGERYKNNMGVYRKSVGPSVLARYKFYLSFENSFCKDYITEKYWHHGLQSGLVPIVMGANYNNRNSVPGSFINVADFRSPKHLARYLKYLDRNDTAYNQYFNWKGKFKVTEGLNMICEICRELNERQDEEKVIALSKFWTSQNLCHGYDKKLKEQLNAFFNKTR